MKNTEVLSKKRGASGALFLNKEGKILLLEPTYKNKWEIPGGIIEEGESPKETCRREVFEELSLDKEVGKLLVLEYQREEDDSYMFVFDGGILEKDDIDKITIQTDEIKQYKFCTLEEVQEKVLKKMFIRIQRCIDAYREKKNYYYETIY